jgi:hypothetical protein
MFLMSFGHSQFEPNLPMKIDEKKRIAETTKYNSGYFLLCTSCHWCASFFRYSELFSKCPQCKIGEIDTMPIGEDETYNFNFNPWKGVELEFSIHKDPIIKQ